jgi:hypothetical protein
VESDPVQAALVAEARQQRGTVRPAGPPDVGVRDLFGFDLVDGLDRQYASPGAKDARRSSPWADASAGARP